MQKQYGYAVCKNVSQESSKSISAWILHDFAVFYAAFAANKMWLFLDVVYVLISWDVMRGPTFYWIVFDFSLTFLSLPRVTHWHTFYSLLARKSEIGWDESTKWHSMHLGLKKTPLSNQSKAAWTKRKGSKSAKICKNQHIVRSHIMSSRQGLGLRPDSTASRNLGYVRAALVDPLFDLQSSSTCRNKIHNNSQLTPFFLHQNLPTERAENRWNFESSTGFGLLEARRGAFSKWARISAGVEECWVWDADPWQIARPKALVQ